MKDSKLVKILKTFSEQEFSEFEKFTDSPFFCNSKILPEFLKYIKQFQLFSDRILQKTGIIYLALN